MTRRHLLVATALASVAFTAPAAAQTELTFNIFFPQTHFSWPVFQAWSDDIAAATNGEIRITFPAQSVAPPPGIVDAVRNGVADGGFIFNGFIEDSAPGTMVTQMPFISRGDSAADSEVLWNTYESQFGEVEDIRGVELVSAFHLGPTYLCSVTDTPITTIDDMRGRRVWALPGTIADTLASMDLAITASPAVQVQELVSRNTVDAHFGLTMETIIAFGVAPYTKSCVDMSPALLTASFSIFFNQRTWDRLSDENRAAITKFSGAALARRLGEATDAADAEARMQLEGMGVTFAPIDEGLLSAMEEASEGVLGEWSKKVGSMYEVDGMAVINEIRTAISDSSAK